MKLIIPSVVGIFAIIGGLYAFDLNYTRASTTKELKVDLCNKDQELSVKDQELLNKIAGQSKRLTQYIAQDRYNWLQERVYRLEDRYQNKQMPQSVKEEHRRLRSEMYRIEKSLSNRGLR